MTLPCFSTSLSSAGVAKNMQRESHADLCYLAAMLFRGEEQNRLSDEVRPLSLIRKFRFGAASECEH
jgi:hypothetical protein